MKTMRRIATILLAIGLALFLAACGSEEVEQTVVLRSEDSVMGITITDTLTLTAVGDALQSSQEIIKFDFSASDEKTMEDVVSNLQIAETYDGIAAATVIENRTSTSYTITVFIDYTGDINLLVEDGLIEKNDTDYVSLAKTQQGMERQGFRVVEQ